MLGYGGCMVIYWSLIRLRSRLTKALDYCIYRMYECTVLFQQIPNNSQPSFEFSVYFHFIKQVVGDSNLEYEY